MRTRRLAGAATGLAAVVVAVVGTSTAPSATAVPVVGSESAEPQPEDPDTVQLAADMGYSVDKLRDQIALQDAMDTIPFEKLDPSYAQDGSSGLATDGFRLWYRSASAPPDALISALKGAGTLDSVEFVRVPMSLHDLMDVAQSSEGEMQGDTQFVGMTIDTELGGVILHPYAGATEVDRSAAEKAAKEAGLPFRWGPPPPEPYTTIRGGQIATPDGAGSCTGGFVVLSPSGNKRVSTAGHCVDPNQGVGQGFSYNGVDHWEVKAYSYDAYHDWATLDKSGQTFAPGTVKYSNSGTIRDVNALRIWSDMDVGDSVSKYGWKTNVTLGTITDVRHCGPGGCATGSKFIDTEPDPAYPDMCDHGDSGGPFMWGNTAFGMVSGGGGVGGTATDCSFMPQQFLDATVMTK